MRLWIALIAVATCTFSHAATRMERFELVVKGPITQVQVTQIEQDLRRLQGYYGIKWEHAAGKASVTLDSGILCPDEVIALINVRSEDGNPLVDLYAPPSLEEAMNRFDATLTSMRKTYASERAARSLRMDANRLHRELMTIYEAIRLRFYDPGPLAPAELTQSPWPTAQSLAQKILFLEAVARREMEGKVGFALDEVEAGFDALAQELKITLPAKEPAKP